MRCQSGWRSGSRARSWIGQLLQTFLVQTGARDPLTLTAIAALLIVVALAAFYFPARRATRLNPVVALRYE